MSNPAKPILKASVLLCALICPNHAGQAALTGGLAQDSSVPRQDGKAPAPQGFPSKNAEAVSLRSAMPQQEDISADKIVCAFGKQGFRINDSEAGAIMANVRLAVTEAKAHGIGNSKVDFAAVEIAQDLSVGTDNVTIRRIVAAIGELSGLPETKIRRSPGPLPIISEPYPIPRRPYPMPRPVPLPQPLPRPYPIISPRKPLQPDVEVSPKAGWEAYFDETVNLWNQSGFSQMMEKNQFFPVKISWEDIGRYQGSVWGDRISDVGIWARKDENDPSSARLAISVRRDSNFRDKVLMVPAENIKVHVKQGKNTIEKTLPQRLKELGLASPGRDKNVIVSNQFAVVPVPGRAMSGDAPPRVAFNFSVYPYGSTNFVITDVIEGSSEAVVGPGSHQLLYANIGGQKAPFTASRADDRQDLLKLEKELKSKGMDVDVQRYYLIQIPLRRDAENIVLSNMGTPPREPRETASQFPIVKKPKKDKSVGPGIVYLDDVKLHVMPNKGVSEALKAGERVEERIENEAGLDRVAIGHGETEGPYSAGSGYQGARADEPIRVTVVYFVTPNGRITDKDMKTFAQAFSQWDNMAIWGGSFVTKE